MTEYFTIIKCDNSHCGFPNRFYSKSMYERCKDVIEKKLFLSFEFKCRYCFMACHISDYNILKNEKII